MSIVKIVLRTRWLALLFAICIPYPTSFAQTAKPISTPKAWISLEIYKAGRDAFEKGDFEHALSYLNAFKNLNEKRLHAPDITPDEIEFRYKLEMAIFRATAAFRVPSPVLKVTDQYDPFIDTHGS